MSPALHITLVILMIIVFYQDWKFRAIHWFIFPLIAIDTFLIFFSQSWSLITPGLNLTFVSIVMVSLFLYISIREKKWTNIFARHFGFGDVLFFVALTPLFSPWNYMLFFTSGMFVSVVMHRIQWLKSSRDTIPLAGYLGLYLIALMAVDSLTNLNLFHQNLAL